MDHDPMFRTVAATFDASLGLPIQDRMMVLEVAWLVLASQERTDALSIPGGFPEMQARQLVRLEKLMSFVRGDTPEAEGEPHYQEDDIDRFLEYVQRVVDNPHDH